MRRKDWHELHFWQTTQHRDLCCSRLPRYLEVFGIDPQTNLGEVLEIGTGPFGGVLPLICASRKVGIDPLCSEYRKLGTLKEAPGVEYVEAYFEEWQTGDRFDTIIAIDALDHGEMGFQLLPRIFDLLRPGGRLYLHVHFRPKEYLNLIHDHPMTEEDLERHLSQTAFVEEKRQFYENDVGGDFCRALVGVWRRPL